MALRHRFPFPDLPDLRRGELPVMPPPMTKSPRSVAFRPEADLDRVVDEVSRYARTRISATQGAGKSTILPIRFAERTGKTVLLVVPLEHLAAMHYAYLYAKYTESVYLVTQPQDELVKGKVNVTTYAWINGYTVINKDNPKLYAGCAMFADEIHESDGYSYVTRTLGLLYPGLENFVEMSATHDPARMPMREMKGSLDTKFFPRISPDKWSVSDKDMPWTAYGLQGNTMIFLDDDKIANRLISEYGVAGVTAFRFHSRMSVSDCVKVASEMFKSDSPLYVVIADYAFRNGGTYDVVSIVDSALVRVPLVKDGRLTFTHREIYLGESSQTATRGARLEGSKCTYYIPEGSNFKPALCMLEAAEADAAALLFKLLGYAVPAELRSFVSLPDDKIPRNIPAALNGFMPIALLPSADLVDFVFKRPSPEVEEVVGLLDDYSIDPSPVIETKNLFADMDFSETAQVRPAVSVNVLGELQELSVAARTLEPGYYYHCSEAVANGSLGHVIWKDLLTMLDENPEMVMGYSAEMRKDAIAMFLMQYNVNVAVGAAITRVGAQREALHGLVRMYPEQVKEWSKWLSQKGVVANALASALLIKIDKLRSPGMVFRQVPANEKLEEATAQKFVEPLLAAVREASRVIQTDDFFSAIGSQLGYDPGPEFPKLQFPSGSVDEDQGGKMYWKTVQMGKTVMHDVRFEPSNPLSWRDEDYVAAVRRMLEDKGVAPNAVRKLVIDAPGVRGDTVMQAVRDTRPTSKVMAKYVVRPVSRSAR